MKRFLLVLVLLLVANAAYAITPIARFDVVPWQRVEYGSTFKLGVVAFSKPGIEDVVFTITGQGYASGTKTASSMTLNDRTGVWEYWVTLSASEFTSNGTFTVSAVVTDNDANERNLSAITMIVEGASAYTHDTCWADSVDGNNTTCTVDNIALPCLDIPTCVDKIAAAGDLDGAIIYLEEGTYDATDSATTTQEWLTITKSAAANESSVIINDGPLATSYLHYKDVTLQSTGSGNYVATSSSSHLWTESCRRIGSGQHTSNSNPVHFSDSTNHYSTDDYTTTSDYAYRQAALVRGATMTSIGNDAFENTWFVINADLDGISNSSNPSWHADAFQLFNNGSTPIDNVILYGYKAVNVSYDGGWITSASATATDVAFVNIFIEMREPATENETGDVVFQPWTFTPDNWDHVVMWNNTFTTGIVPSTATFTNSSIKGNYFYAWVDWGVDIGDPDVPNLEYGNTDNNDMEYNHFETVYDVTPTCIQNSKFIEQGWPCPHNRAKLPDSNSPKTATYGDGQLQDVYTESNFTYPVAGGDLIDVFTSVVPVDVYNSARGSTSDIGAVEHTSGTIMGAGAGSTTIGAGGGTTTIN